MVAEKIGQMMMFCSFGVSLCTFCHRQKKKRSATQLWIPGSNAGFESGWLLGIDQSFSNVKVISFSIHHMLSIYWRSVESFPILEPFVTGKIPPQGNADGRSFLQEPRALKCLALKAIALMVWGTISSGNVPILGVVGSSYQLCMSMAQCPWFLNLHWNARMIFGTVPSSV